jgi:hypothetical protein
MKFILLIQGIVSITWRLDHKWWIKSGIIKEGGVIG